jgi:hypothetical protein
VKGGIALKSATDGSRCKLAQYPVANGYVGDGTASGNNYASSFKTRNERPMRNFVTMIDHIAVCRARCNSFDLNQDLIIFEVCRVGHCGNQCMPLRSTYEELDVLHDSFVVTVDRKTLF